VSRVVLAGLLGALTAMGCGKSKEHNDKDVESDAVPRLAPGRCDDAAVVAATSLFDASFEPSPDRPPEGSRVALEGIPRAVLACTQLGCSWECCDNGCGSSPECTYDLPVGAGTSVCLAGAGLTCGGTDCSPYCTPFSTAPKRRYRFVGTLRYRARETFLDLETYCRID
jgi:hypothetical protein